MPALSGSIIKGMVMATVRTAWMFCVIRLSLAWLKRWISWSLRTKALTTRTPARFSCMTVLSASSRACTTAKEREGAVDDQDQPDSDNGDEHHEEQRPGCGLVSTAMIRLPISSSGDAHHDAQQDHDDLLHLGDIVGQARDQLAGFQLVQIAEGEGLHLGEESGCAGRRQSLGPPTRQ